MQNRNPSISQDLNRIFDLKGESTDLVADYIQPVMPISPFANIVRNVVSTTTGGTIYTTPADKDFYLTSVFLSYSKDNVNTATEIAIVCTILGVQRYIMDFAVIATTAQSDSNAIVFNVPLKIDRNTAIFLNSTNATAAFRMAGLITGYTVETTKGV